MDSIFSAVRILIFSRIVDTPSTNDLECRIDQSNFAKIWERYKGTAGNSGPLDPRPDDLKGRATKPRRIECGERTCSLQEGS